MRRFPSLALVIYSLISIGCGSEGGGADPAPLPDAHNEPPPDASSEAAADSGVDALPESAIDVASDTVTDTLTDTVTDPPVDSPADTANDTPSDVPLDLPPDTPTDVPIDTPTDSPVDAPIDAQIPTIALLVASDYSTTAEMIAVDVQQQTTLGHLLSDDQDSVVDANNGLGFLLRRTVDEVQVLDSAQPWVVTHTIDVTSGAGHSNPWAVVVPAHDKAYVVRYGSNVLSIINPSTGANLGEIDLSAYVIDSDGLVDAFGGVFDPSCGRVYIGLQRIDQLEWGTAPDYVHTCNDSHPAIVGIDTLTDSIIDLNGTEDGEALQLSSFNPWRMIWDDVSERIVLLSIGCASVDDGGISIRQRRGIEAIEPITGISSWLWTSEALDRPADLIWISNQEAVVGIDDASFTRTWYAWNPSTTQLGPALSGVPNVPLWDGARGLVGLVFGSTGLDVVRYDLDEGTTSMVVENAYNTPSVFPASSVRLR